MGDDEMVRSLTYTRLWCRRAFPVAHTALSLFTQPLFQPMIPKIMAVVRAFIAHDEVNITLRDAIHFPVCCYSNDPYTSMHFGISV